MRRIGELRRLYSKIYFSKKNILLIVISILSIFIIAYSSLNLGFSNGEFQFLRDEYVDDYVRSTFNYILILNSAIIPILFLCELKEEINMVNSILIPRVSKNLISISKISIMIEISFIFCAAEVMIIGILPVIFYPNFTIEISYLLIGLYVFLYSIFCVIIVNVLMKYLKIFVVGAVPIIIYLISNILKDKPKINNFIICLDTLGQRLTSYNSLYFLIGVIIILFVIYMV